MDVGRWANHTSQTCTSAASSSSFWRREVAAYWPGPGRCGRGDGFPAVMGMLYLWYGMAWQFWWRWRCLWSPRQSPPCPIGAPSMPSLRQIFDAKQGRWQTICSVGIHFEWLSWTILLMMGGGGPGLPPSRWWQGGGRLWAWQWIELWYVDCKLWIVNFGQLTFDLDFSVWIVNCKLWILNCRLWFGFWIVKS